MYDRKSDPPRSHKPAPQCLISAERPKTRAWNSARSPTGDDPKEEEDEEEAEAEETAEGGAAKEG